MKTFGQFGVQIPEILLPKDIDLPSWSVVACDQYTQDKNYWQEAARAAQGKPSTLNLIFPEAFLGDGDGDGRIRRIKDTMAEYLQSGLFQARETCVYLERRTEYGRTRRGLVLAVDLETYEWNPGTKALIRATEATVPERIPPRMKIRRGAALELPHIMLLAHDPTDVLVGGAARLAKAGTPLYDGDLMHHAGHITGWGVAGAEAEALIETALAELARAGTGADGSTFLFAVGDGNHSLATAKAVWDEHKASLTAAERAESPVRYALVEVVNIYDGGLTFEPIHRVIFRQDSTELTGTVQRALGGTGRTFGTAAELTAFVSDRTARGARYGFIAGGTFSALETGVTDLAIAALQPVLDEFLDAHGAAKEDIDYIHGTDDTLLLGARADATAILLPPIAKDSFFQTIASRGALPRKSFSMGEASEKRFYVEARRLFPAD